MGSAEARGAARLLASWQALAVIAVVITALALSGTWAVQRQITDRAVRAAVISSQSINLLVVSRNISIDDVSVGLLQANRDAVDGDLVLLKSRDEVVGLRVWSLDTGRPVYSDVDHRDAAVDLRGKDLKRSRAGVPFTRYLLDEFTGRQVLAVLMPFDVNGDGSLDAVSEVLLPRERIDGSISEYSRWLYAGAALALVLTLTILISVRRRQAAQDRAATHDAMTGLGNRVLLHRAARTVLARSSESTPSALLLIDLDGFKGVNDTLGHHTGDELLVAVAGAIRRTCRPTDDVIRLGGDEFAVLLPQMPDREAAERVARNLVEAIREPVAIGEVTLQIDASVGIAFAPDHGTRLDQVLRCADIAMYDAKRHGASVAVYQPGTDVPADQQASLLPELRRAVNNGQLSLYYQPVCAVGATVNRVEALLRWRHPKRGLLLAEEFVPAAEHTSLIKQINAWVIETAARQCARWREQGHELQVSVNVATNSLIEGTLAAQVVEATAVAGLPPSALKIEVNETALFGRMRDKTIETLRALNEAGVPVAIDDVGRAYTTVFTMSELPLTELKIHPEFVAAVTEDRVAVATVSHLVTVAHHMGARILAEGVETLSTWSRVVDLGCDAVQGHVLTPPLPPDHLIAWLERWSTTAVGTPPGAVPTASSDAVPGAVPTAASGTPSAAPVPGTTRTDER